MTSLAADAPGATGRSARVADVVRGQILDGTFLPGTRLSEPQICAAVDVSRNTLREAFRTLVEERLVVHELNRGVFVRVPTPQDVRDLYDARRLVECAAVRGHTPGRAGGRAGLPAVEEVLRRADERAAVADWVGVGTADIDFHRALVALAGSVRITGLMQGIWHEVRLVFHVVADPGALLHAYLDDAERHVLDAYARRDSSR